MLDSYWTKFLSGCLLSVSAVAVAETLAIPQATKTPQVAQTIQVPQTTQSATGIVQPKATEAPKTTQSPAEIAYQTQMLDLSRSIAQKIAQIQAKQQQIDKEIYPASIPPLQGQKDQLQKELDALSLRQKSLEAQKTASDMAASLQQTKP